MRAACALPVIALPVQSEAAEVGEIGFSILGYRERAPGIKVSEPVLWITVPFARAWQLRASALVDIVTGASPRFVTNAGGPPAQSFTGASVNDRRKAGEVRLQREWEDFTLAVSRTVSREEDYLSRAFGLEGKLDLANRHTTLTAGYGRANDRVGSSEDPSLDQPRDTREYLLGLSQVVSPVAFVQTQVQWSRGRGWYDDPYRATLTFRPGASLPAFAPDHRPAARESIAWLTRYRHHVAGAAGTLQLDYRLFRDDWGIRSHTIEAGWSQDLAAGWTLRPALRWYWQSAADFYSPVVPQPAREFQSSDQRLAAFGGLSPSLRLGWRDGQGLAIEATAGWYRNAANLRPGAGGSAGFETLRAAYGVLTFTREF